MSIVLIALSILSILVLAIAFTILNSEFRICNSPPLPLCSLRSLRSLPLSPLVRATTMYSQFAIAPYESHNNCYLDIQRVINWLRSIV